MGAKGTIRFTFGVGKWEIGRFWRPVILELKRKGTKKVLRLPVEDCGKLREDGGRCYIEIQDLPEGMYTLNVFDIETGLAIVTRTGIELHEDMVECGFERRATARQPNTPAMDLVVDAPYRLQKSYPYVPVIVYLKDISPGKVRLRSIEFFNWRSGKGMLEALPPGSIVKVLDSEGAEVVENGTPTPLRFDAGEDHETVNTDPWYRIILLARQNLTTFEGTHPGYGKARYFNYAVTVTYRGFLGIGESKQVVLRTLVPECDLPRVDDWYYGDTHYHSDFTDNPYEYGGPLPMTAEVANATGLSWVTVTDHSYCLGHTKTPEEAQQGNRWLSYKKAVTETNRHYPNVLLIAAEEVTVRKNLAGLHLLSFNNPFIEDTHVAGFGSLPIEEVLERMLQSPLPHEGFIYAAHPSSGGYIWLDEDYAVVTNPRYRDLFCGLQVFNEKILFECRTDSSIDRQHLDPYDMFKKSNRRKPWSKELDEGVRQHWVEKFLLPSLREYAKAKELKKCFILAGSDAHMDFNCAFRPHPAFLVHYLNDNAFGKARTMAYLPEQKGRRLTEGNLLGALRTGKTLLTDGPIVLFSLRKEGDDNVYRLGDTMRIQASSGFDLHIECHSTVEFGPIEKIQLFLGTTKGETDITAQVEFKALKKSQNLFHGSTLHTFSGWTEGPSYLRMEGCSRIDPKTGEALFRCVTNPIWIIGEQ